MEASFQVHNRSDMEADGEPWASNSQSKGSLRHQGEEQEKLQGKTIIMISDM